MNIQHSRSAAGGADASAASALRDGARQPALHHPQVRLLADIGGTNARFALETGPGQVGAIWITPCAAHATLAGAIANYLQQPATVAAGAAQLAMGGIAIANPVDGDAVRMTNHHWSFSIAGLQAELGLRHLLVVNDFKALACALPLLQPAHLCQVGGGRPRADMAIGLVGAGTGLGVSGLVPQGERWIALDSEGGHSSFAPANEREIDILRFAQRHHGHVSNERLVSGSGMVLVYQALAERARCAAESLTPPDILKRGLSGSCAVCRETLEVFCEMLGTIAADIAITLGAKGGMYIGGGIVPRLGAFFAASGFRRRFERKGRFSDYLAHIPTYVITEQFPALIGMSAMLAELVPLAD